MHVYLIQNIVNGKCYVGQHAGDDLDKYWKHNVRAALAGRGNKLFLYRAIRKYGPENFTIRTIHTPVDAEDMTRAEIAYIKFFGTQDDELGYNITAGGPGRLGTTSICSSETRKKMSDTRKGVPKTEEWAKAIGDSQRGRSLTPEHIAALKAGQKGCKKPPRTEEHKKRLRESRERNRLAKLTQREEYNGSDSA
jgi:group I intron endonuclease